MTGEDRFRCNNCDELRGGHLGEGLRCPKQPEDGEFIWSPLSYVPETRAMRSLRERLATLEGRQVPSVDAVAECMRRIAELEGWRDGAQLIDDGVCNCGLDPAPAGEAGGPRDSQGVPAADSARLSSSDSPFPARATGAGESGGSTPRGPSGSPAGEAGKKCGCCTEGPIAMRCVAYPYCESGHTRRELVDMSDDELAAFDKQARADRSKLEAIKKLVSDD